MIKRKITKTSLTATLVILILCAPCFTRQKPQPKEKAAFNKQAIEFLGEQINIIRDSFGTPHVLSPTQRGAYFGGGYAVAQDRLYQMERYRRSARGEMAEIEGREALGADEDARTLGYTEAELQVMFDSLSKDVQQSYQAYADGINAYMKEAVSENKLPEGFKKAGLTEPSPWKVTDSVSIAVMMATRFGTSGGREAQNLRILTRLKKKFGDQAEAIFNDIFWLNDTKALSTIAETGKASASRPAGARDGLTLPLDRLSDHALAKVASSAQQAALFEYADRHGLPTKWGSYCWLVAPSRNISGNAVLVGGPQMKFGAPQIAHEIHYLAGGLNAIGMAFAGIPGVLVGHNDHLAWSITSGLTDVEDVFAEKVNPANIYQYMYKGRYVDMKKRVEMIKVKGEEPSRLEVYHTEHGPVLGWDSEAGIAYSFAVASSGHEISGFEALHGIARAGSIQEVSKLVESIYTNQNIFAASDEGDLGYWHCGRLPIRASGYDQRLPAPGTGEYDWKGLRPFSEMPQVINPKQGYIVNWNNKPIQSWNNGDTPWWGEAYHGRRIEQLIKSNSRLSFEQIRDIARDVATHDANADHLKPFLLEAVKKTGIANRDARAGQAAAYLQAWDDHTVDGSVAKTIFDAWLEAVREAIFNDEFGDLILSAKLAGARSFNTLILSPSFILHVLEGPQSGVPLSRDYLNGRSKEDVIVEALSKAVDSLTKKLGPQMNLWAFKQGEIDFAPLPGIPSADRGTYIQAIELSKPMIRGVNILPPGQSENPLSAHYTDQREMAGYWLFKPMLYKAEQLQQPVSAGEGKK